MNAIQIIGWTLFGLLCVLLIACFVRLHRMNSPVAWWFFKCSAVIVILAILTLSFLSMP